MGREKRADGSASYGVLVWKKYYFSNFDFQPKGRSRISQNVTLRCGSKLYSIQNIEMEKTYVQ